MIFSVPSASTLAKPVVSAPFTVILPSSSIVNVNLETTVVPLGAAVSSSSYVPAARPWNLISLPSNSNWPSVPVRSVKLYSSYS